METNKKQHYATLAFRYARSLSRWIKAGRPVRSDVEIHDIFMSYCQECEHLDQGSGRCSVCGCRVGTGKSPLVNKIAMGTEQCPHEKWP